MQFHHLHPNLGGKRKKDYNSQNNTFPREKDTGTSKTLTIPTSHRTLSPYTSPYTAPLNPTVKTDTVPTMPSAIPLNTTAEQDQARAYNGRNTTFLGNISSDAYNERNTTFLGTASPKDISVLQPFTTSGQKSSLWRSFVSYFLPSSSKTTPLTIGKSNKTFRITTEEQEIDITLRDIQHPTSVQYLLKCPIEGANIDMSDLDNFLKTNTPTGQNIHISIAIHGNTTHHQIHHIASFVETTTRSLLQEANYVKVSPFYQFLPGQHMPIVIITLTVWSH